MKARPDIRLLGCLLLGLVTYLPTIRGEFVWDDAIFLRRWVGSTDTLSEILFPPPGVIGTNLYYRPVTQGFATLLWAVLGSDDPAGWHLAIIAIHLVTIALVFVLLRDAWLLPAQPAPVEGDDERGRREWAAAAGAALYACWPANAESVAWISSRADTLLGPFLLGALLLHLRARDRGTRPAGAALLFFGALLVKETGVVFLPLAAVCTLLVPRSRPLETPRPGGPAALWLPYLLVYVVYSLMRKHSMGAGTSLGSVAATMLAKLDPAVVFRAWGFYVQEALSLGEAPPFLQYAPSSTATWFFAVLGTAALVVAALCLRNRRSWPYALAAAWFVLPLGPPLATVSSPLSQNAVTVHYLYLPNVAIAALAALAVAAVLRDERIRSLRRPALAVALAVFAILAFRAHRLCEPWMTEGGLWARAVADNPDSCLARQNRGIAHWDDDPSLALRELRIAAWTCKPADSPQRQAALVSLSQIYLSRGDYALSRNALWEARTLATSLPMFARLVGLEAALELFEEIGPVDSHSEVNASIHRNDLRRVMASLEDAARLDPFAPEPRLSMALLALAVGERPRALRLYEETHRLASSDSSRKLALGEAARLRAEIANETDPVRRSYEQGQIAEMEGRREDALASYRSALAAAPGRADLMLALADVLASSGDVAGAIEQATAATEADPDNAIAWLNLGVYRSSLHDGVGMEQAFAKADELVPGWKKACVNHGRSLEALGRPQDACAVYERCLASISRDDIATREVLLGELARARARVPR